MNSHVDSQHHLNSLPSDKFPSDDAGFHSKYDTAILMSVIKKKKKLQNFKVINACILISQII